MARNIIIITGASSGIGREFARQIDPYFQRVDEIWMIGRNRERLIQTASSMEHKTRILSMDITDRAEMVKLADMLEKYGVCVRMLINCAGYGLMGAFAEADQNMGCESGGQLGMIRVNCEALTHMTHCCLPYMAKGSRILQLASSAAFLPQPDFAVYAATKAYVLSFSRALGEELKGKGIYVTSVCPGPVDTPFFEIAEQRGKTLSVKKYTMVSARRVVRLSLKDSYRRRSVSVCSLPIRAFWVLTKCVPHPLILKLMGYIKEREKGTHADKEDV